MRKDIIPDYIKNITSLDLLRPPSIIMREQAEDLNTKTHGLLRGSVATYTADGATTVRHTFYLVVPSLENLAYSLFYVWHNEKPYPANVLRVGSHQSKAVICKTEETFEQELYEIFHSDDTNNIIRNLLAQAHVAMREED